MGGQEYDHCNYLYGFRILGNGCNHACEFSDMWARGRGLEASKIMAKQIEGFVKQK